MQLFLVPDVPAIVAISCALFGFFGVGAYPIGLELAVEATFPVEETISTAFIFMSGEPRGARGGAPGPAGRSGFPVIDA